MERNGTYPMFRIKIKKKYVYPCKPQFFYIESGVKGVYFLWTCFSDVLAPSSPDTLSDIVTSETTNVRHSLRARFFNRVVVWAALRIHESRASRIT